METFLDYNRFMDINPYYITGICEGEASFTYSRQSNNKKNVSLYFSIRLCHDDKSLIKQIREYFEGVGNIYMVKPRYPTKNSGYTRAEVYYRISKLKELRKIVEHFDQYPFIGKKSESYKIWKEIFLFKTENHHKRLDDLSKLNKMIDRLSSLSSGGKNKNHRHWTEEMRKLEQGLPL